MAKEGLLQKIYDATNDGKDIIMYYYPQAVEKEKFKLRGNERTASAAMKKINGIWRVTDFGDEGSALSPINICMKEENIDFTEALFKLADRYGITESLSPSKNKPDIKQKPATAKEPEGHFNYKAKKNLTEFELSVLGPKVKQSTCDKYSYYSLEWYSKTKDGKTTIISSNENYPIFMRDCGGFKKIYQPLNPDKAYRFFYVGDKPQNYINGFAELKKAYEDKQNEELFDEDGEPVKNKLKIDCAILCSGERDALNVAGHGYYPLWLNSESATLTDKDFNDIARMVDRVYNIPDIDDTGRRKGIELALQYMDIYTVELPEWLLNYKDMRGKPRKDLRDFLEFRPSAFDFKELLRSARSCKFWEQIVTDKGVRNEINTVFLLHFLKYNGFHNLIGVNNTSITVQVTDYIVKEIEEKKLIRGFVSKYLENKHVDISIQNLFLNSKRTSTAFVDDLKEITLNFNDSTIDSQYLFFKNKAVKVFPDKIEEIRNREITNYVWEKNLCKHNFKRIEPAFTAKYNPQTGAIDDFSIHHTKSHYFRFLINSSRIFWREELEHRKTGNPDTDNEYSEKHKFDIEGPRLTEEESNEQIHHLINKFFTIGYLLHHQKLSYRAWAVWLMENKLTEESESSGGSGKSFMIDFLTNIINTITLDGRNRKLTDNPHVLDRVNEHTRLIRIDDAYQYFNFDFFYGAITGNITINKKQKTSQELDFSVSPKFAITSNFPPKTLDASTYRRLLFCVMSDYYHKKTDDNDYLSDNFISDDFGYEICRANYAEEFWNEDFNFCVDCLQFYLQTVACNAVIQPPMENVFKRVNIAAMGDQFHEWASVYFSPESGRLNRLLDKSQLFSVFKRPENYSGPSWSAKKFKKALIAFAKNCEYIEEFNPKSLCGKDGRIVKWVNGTTTGVAAEMIYFKTYDKDVKDDYEYENIIY